MNTILSEYFTLGTSVKNKKDLTYCLFRSLTFPEISNTFLTDNICLFVTPENAGKIRTRVTPNTDTIYAVRKIHKYFRLKEQFE